MRGCGHGRTIQAEQVPEGIREPLIATIERSKDDERAAAHERSLTPTVVEVDAVMATRRADGDSRSNLNRRRPLQNLEHFDVLFNQRGQYRSSHARRNRVGRNGGSKTWADVFGSH